MTGGILIKKRLAFHREGVKAGTLHRRLPFSSALGSLWQSWICSALRNPLSKPRSLLQGWEMFLGQPGHTLSRLVPVPRGGEHGAGLAQGLGSSCPPGCDNTGDLKVALRALPALKMHENKVSFFSKTLSFCETSKQAQTPCFFTNNPV